WSGVVPCRVAGCSASEPSMFGGFAPSSWQRGVCDGPFGRAADEGDAVEVDGFPLVVVDLEGQPLFSWLLVYQECPAWSGHVDDSGPESLSYARADVADVDPCGDLEEPLGEVSTETGGTGGEGGDGHQKATAVRWLCAAGIS